VRDQEYGRGHIEVVDVKRHRAALDGDHAAGAMTLALVVTEAVYAETGGIVDINGVRYDYTAYDDGDEDEEGIPTLTLASPGLVADVADDTWVNVWDPLYNTIKTTKAARVRLLGATDNDDTIRAEFAQQLVDRLGGGIRGTIGEECLLELDNTTWRIIEIFGLDDPDTGLGDGHRWEADDSYVLTADDIAAGVAVVPLSHQPILESVLLVLGIPQPPTEYTVDYAAQTVTCPLGGWEKVGELIWVHYEYRVGVTTPVLTDNPTTIGAPLRVWYSAEAETLYAPGEAMTLWHDQSGNGHHATSTGIPSGAGKAPMWKFSDGPSGGPSIQFPASIANDGTVDKFTLPNGSLDITNTVGMEIFAWVFSAPSPVGSENGLWSFWAPDSTFFPYADGDIYEGWQSTTRHQFDGSGIRNEWVRYNVRSGPGEFVVRVNETTRFSTALSTFAPPDDAASAWIGESALGGSFFRKFVGLMTCVAIFNRLLTSEERAAMDAWMIANPSGGVPS
jgi:hypothetical protein